MTEELHILLNKTDESFNPAESGKCRLVYEIGEKSFGYSVFDEVRSRFIAIGHFRNRFADAVRLIPLLTLPFRSVRGVICNSKFTLIPEALFQEEEKESYFGFLHDRETGDTVLYDRLEHLGICPVFAIQGHLRKEIEALFRKAEISHISSVLIRALWLKVKNIPGKKVFLNLRDDQFDVLAFEDGRLIYCNSFRFLTQEDIAYYLIFVYEQLDLNPGEVGVTLTGNLDRYSPVYDLLFRYIRKVDFIERNTDYSYSNFFSEIPGHYFFSLLNPLP